MKAVKNALIVLVPVLLLVGTVITRKWLIQALKDSPSSADTTLVVAELNAIRRSAGATFKDAEYLAENGRHEITDSNGFGGTWAKSPRDPMKLLPLFPHIRLVKGYRLVAYQWIDGIGGYAQVYGLPDASPFPDPSTCLQTKHVPAAEYIQAYDYDYPCPPGAVDELGSLVEADGSALSYAEKALFLKEVGEIGAYWHGIGWGDCHLVDSLDTLRKLVSPDEPKGGSGRFTSSSPATKQADPIKDWIWTASRFVDLRPRVHMGTGKVQVIWNTYSGRGVQTLSRWVFTFDRNSTKTLEPEITTLAEGHLGFMY